MLTVRQTLRKAKALIAAGGIPDADLEAELLLMHCLGTGRVELYTRLEELMPDSKVTAYRSAVERRLVHEPTSYITNTCGFYDREFYIDFRALIPRPETELLVEEVVGFLSRDFSKKAAVLVADVGAGSGVVGIAIALSCPTVQVLAIDVCSEALEVARINCARHQVGDRVSLLVGDMLGPVAGPLDVIVANLPYVTDADMAGLMEEVQGFEPHLALAGGEDGLEHIRRLLPQARERLGDDGLLLVEIGQGQGAAAVEAARACFPLGRIELLSDLAGIDRVMKVTAGSVGREERR